MEAHARGKGDDAMSLVKMLHATSEKAKREYLASDRGVTAVCDSLQTVRMNAFVLAISRGVSAMRFA